MILRILVLCVLAVFIPRLSFAGCTPIATATPRVWPAAAGSTTVTITFLGHASFLIESPGGVRAVTDYNGTNVPIDPPDIATMNHAHTTHYTLWPDPKVRHVLHGWSESAKPPVIDLHDGDMRVTNLATNIRDWHGGTELYGNSIFVFETAGLCIAHLSHLHHVLTDADVMALGRVDVLMVPVDNSWTLPLQDAMTVIEQVQPRIILPMHYFTHAVLQRFLDLERPNYPIDVRTSPVLEVSRATLPERPVVIALPGGY